MDEERFRELVGEAIDSLPIEFAKRLNNVAVVVEDYPTVQKLRKLRLPPWALLFGLYEGVPQTKRGSYSGVLPDKITIFKNSIEKVARDDEEIKAQVRATVIHEIGHHFGLSDEDLRRKKERSSLSVNFSLAKPKR
jgi:predicted Zn-dependent protease with MMP-like domain